MAEKDGNSVRLRLFFDDPHLLNKSQRSQGLRRCWLFLQPGLATVGDLASHIRQNFGFRDRIVLSIDDFVLPAFESTCIITDKDMIRVTKKEVKRKDICRPCDGQNHLHDSQIVRANDIAFSKNLLADGNSQESSQGNGSHDKDILISSMENAVHVCPSSGDSVTAKRKRENSNQLLSSKKNNVEEKNIETLVTSTECVIEKKGSGQKKSFSNVNGNLEDALHAEYNTSGDEDGFEDGQADPDFHLTIQKTSSSMSCRERGQCDETEHHHEFDPRNCCDVRKNDVHKNQPRLEMIHHNSDSEEDVVPVVVQPGHIHFEQREDIRQQADGAQHSLLFNGVSDPRIRNWIEKKNLPEANNYDQCLKSDGVRSNHKPEVISSSNVMEPHKHLKHFESLTPLSRLPAKGDILAYRYVAQSSSLYRELSFPQVGKVSSFDSQSLQIILDPVQDYEILLGENGNGAILQQNVFLDQEAGSSEIDYSSLVDVRLLKAHYSEETASHEDPARKDGWEEALAKGNSNAPSVSAAGTHRKCKQNKRIVYTYSFHSDKSDGWAQWIPNKSTSSRTCKQANTSVTGRSNGRTNPAPNRRMANWAMNNCTAYRPVNRNNTSWTSNTGYPGWTPHVTAGPIPWNSLLGTAPPTPWTYRSPSMNLPLGSHPNKMVLHGGNPGSGK